MIEGKISESQPIIVIALSGLARSGKDTAAKFLIAHHDMMRLSFADGLRAAFASVSGPSWDLHKEVEASGRSLRWLMQTLGTECREEVGCPDHWIDQVAILIRYLSRYHPEPKTRFVITDLRYRREAEILLPKLAVMGGRMETWKVERPSLVPIPESAHSSETSVAHVVPDRTIVNGGTKADLARQIDDAFHLFSKGVAR